MTDPVLAAEKLTRVFREGDRELPVISGLDLTVMPGERHVITGVSGSGKSSLLHLLLGIDRPDAGSVRVNGSDLASLSSSAAAGIRLRQMGMVFQFHYLLPDFSARENIAMPALLAGTARAPALARAGELAERVSLSDRVDALPARLSGGERQRVAVARALINRPQIVLADEPTGSLDEQTSALVEDLILDVVGEAGAALVLVTHNLRLAARSEFSHRWTLHRGKLEPA